MQSAERQHGGGALYTDSSFLLSKRTRIAPKGSICRTADLQSLWKEQPCYAGQGSVLSSWKIFELWSKPWFGLLLQGRKKKNADEIHEKQVDAFVDPTQLKSLHGTTGYGSQLMRRALEISKQLQAPPHCLKPQLHKYFARQGARSPAAMNSITVQCWE